MSPADLQRLVDALQAERLKSTVPAVEGWIQEWGQKQLDALGVSTSFDMRNPLVTDFLDGFRDVKLVGINDTTATTIRDVVQRASEEGQGIDEIRRRIGGVFDDAKGYRAERIARTEAVGSANAANVAAWQISGLVDEKEWLAVPDDQTRETHADMDGQKVGISEAFTSPSGATTQGPGMFGIPEEDINCRCTARPIINYPSGKAADLDRVAMWRAFDVDVRAGESRIAAAFASAFEAQRRDVLDALR